MKNHTIAMIAVGVAALAGCSPPSFDGSIVVPPPEPINATLRWANPTIPYSEFQAEGTDQVLARVDSVQEYATVRPDRERPYVKVHWYLVVCAVLKVEKGDWKQQKLVFPASEGSGGLAECIPLSFIKGRFFLFGMRHTKGLPEITSCQRRSHFPSHRKIEEPNWVYSFGDAQRVEKFKAIRQAVWIKDVTQPFSADRQLGRFLVVDTWQWHDYGQSWLHVLDTNTLERVPFRVNAEGEVLILDGEAERKY